ncbi:hypothetical protein [Labedella endophytica]|uniref:Uncharacterized protein n=1 Tax=Labedella endophytica TaxID=1523160 RepID=A0A433JSE4_9MICO|nr:hypothetical protein [Labedella endophytica]RUR01223.1 hypothetical protein ELQ94_06825 [Labedella endophytica]
MALIPLPDDLELKIERAEHHLRELDEMVTDYTSGLPMTLLPSTDGTRIDDQQVPWGVRANLREPPPRAIRAVAGDVGNNIRSVLDYLARALVRSNGGTPVDGPGGTQFPIRVTPSMKALVIAGGVSAGALTEIATLQPGPDGTKNRHPLALLNRLNNGDKHQQPTVVAGGLTIPSAFRIVDLAAEPPYGMVSSLLRWLVHDEWAVMPMFPFREGAAVTVDAAVVETIVTLEGEGPVLPSIVDDLDYLLRFVRDDVVPRFRPYFDDPWPEDVFSHHAVTDPIIAAKARIFDGVTEALKGLVDSFPYRDEIDGKPRLLVLGLAEGLNVDPRLLT